jgi:ATP-dependent DNA helicase DinG
VVFTSATLATSDGFGWFLSQVGADNATTLEVPSPFDFRCQAAMLVSPASMPIPDWKHPQVYRDAAAREVREIVRFTEGRTLALFTSWESLRAAKAALTGCPYRVLAQGDMPPHKLLAAFQHDVQSVLLAVASFWEGIDVQGPALTTLIVDRLPFPVRDDPMSDWLSSTPGRNEWTEYRFPVACLKLTQGVGRLIRSVSDRGLVVLLDPRLRGMPYGRALLRRLPRMYHVDRLEDAAPWVLDNVLPMRAAR